MKISAIYKHTNKKAKETKEEKGQTKETKEVNEKENVAVKNSFVENLRR